MRYVRLGWAALCVVTAGVMFVRLPAWDTGVDELDWLSGAETFAAVAFALAVVWLVGASILAALDDALAKERAAGGTASRLLLNAFVKTVLVVGLGIAGFLFGGSLGDATCTKAGEPGDILYGFECLGETLAGAGIGALVGVAAGVAVLLVRPTRRRQ